MKKTTLLLCGLLATIFSGMKGIKPEVSAEIKAEIANQSLDVVGEVPTWLSGTLVRNGPIKVTINGKSNAHWFDGLAMLHAFSFQEGKVHYSNKFLRTDAYHKVFEEGVLDYRGFAQDPCRSLFQRFFTFFFPPSHLAIPNANVNVAKLANAYVALTETPLPVQFDVKTLDTLGVLQYQDELPKDQCWESAHPHRDLDRKETLNYLIKFGYKSYYTLYRIEENSTKRTVIAEVPVAEPAYMHSFAMTTNYVILTEFPIVVNPSDLITKGQAFIKNFSWKPERGTKFTVVDRKNGNVVGQYVTKPFFAFHHANAFEQNDVLHLDIVAYEDADILTKDYLNLNSSTAEGIVFPTRLERFSLSLKTGEISSDLLLSQSSEFPRINEKRDGQDYTYVYVAGLSNRADNEQVVKSDALYKINVTTKELLVWSETECCPGEPIFIATPDAKEEDDGVILALVLDTAHHSSFLLILDGKTFKEIGRAQAPHAIPLGFHGQHFP